MSRVVVVEQLLDLAELNQHKGDRDEEQHGQDRGHDVRGPQVFPFRSLLRVMGFMPASAPRPCREGHRRFRLVDVGLRPDPESVRQGSCEVEAAGVPVLRILRKCLAEHRVERRQLGTFVGNRRW